MVFLMVVIQETERTYLMKLSYQIARAIYACLLICMVLVTGCQETHYEKTEISERDQTEYFAVIMQGKKVGYAIHTRKLTDKQVTTTDKVHLTINRMNVPISMTMAAFGPL